ncbi:MAG: hypothetical protein HOP11_12730 [Saprospiraceae bacterium]|nr:hypothetical protein [Saprospiraceae bacterium]
MQNWIAKQDLLNKLAKLDCKTGSAHQTYKTGLKNRICSQNLHELFCLNGTVNNNVLTDMPLKIRNFHFWLSVKKIFLTFGFSASGGTSQVPERYTQCQETPYEHRQSDKNRQKNQRFVKLKEVQANTQSQRFCTTFNFTPTHPCPPTTPRNMLFNLYILKEFFLIK